MVKIIKVPEWFPVDKFDIDVAERLIEYKKKMSEMYCDESSSKKTTKSIKKDESSKGQLVGGSTTNELDSDEKKWPPKPVKRK
jgi:hypothetical protein